MTTFDRILAVDTSSLVQSIAIVDGDLLLAERTLKTRRGHSGALLAAIDAMLRDVRLTATDLDLLVCGAGPGSFTGLRIGLACLKAIAFAQQIPLVTQSSLHALAWSALPAQGLLVPLVDARKGELYMGLYRSGGDRVEAVMSDRALPPEAFRETLEPYRAAAEEPIFLLGSGLHRYAEAVQNGLADFPSVIALGLGFDHVRAVHLVRLVRMQPTLEIPPLDTLEPNYQRASDAELHVRTS
ncbi:MAG: tRNA (adenosine(37)-N6)-threonylcarbamoyltransferase complex dimerization subunit type 1 TsaB [Myxococcota bacterium]